MPVKNSCDCRNPPGGRIVCEPHQLAICGVINGVIRRECLDPPIDVGTTALANWILNQVSDNHRNANSNFTASDLQTLRSEIYTSSSGEVLKFSVPENRKKAIRSLT